MERHDALMCWEFLPCDEAGRHDIREGREQDSCSATVSSGRTYRFDEARPEYKHVRDVEWLSKTAGVKIREKELVRKTLTDITKYPGQVADAKRALNMEEHSELLDRIKRCRAHPDFEANEVVYKLEVAAQVNMARERFQSGTEGWEDLLRRAFTSKLNNLTNCRTTTRFSNGWVPTRTGAGGRCTPCGQLKGCRKSVCKASATKSPQMFSDARPASEHRDLSADGGGRTPAATGEDRCVP